MWVSTVGEKKVVNEQELYYFLLLESNVYLSHSLHNDYRCQCVYVC